MKKLIALFCVMLLAFSLVSCSSGPLSDENELSAKVSADENKTYKFINGETETPTSYPSYKTSAQSFAFAMLKAMSREGESFAFSPAALYAQLSLLQNAASGSTKGELQELTGKNILPDDLNDCNGYFFSRLEKLGTEKAAADIYGCMVFNEGTAVSQDLLIKRKNFYAQELYRFDFGSTDILEELNSFLKVKTGCGKLVKSLDGDMILAGSCRFTDSWLKAPRESLKGSFNGSKGEEAAEFHISDETYFKSKNCEGIIKNFKNTPCKFIALLPDKAMSVGDYIASLNYGAYRDILDSIGESRVKGRVASASLPVFSDGFTGDLKPALIRAGVKEIFDNGSFYGLSYGKKASVGSVSHSASFRIKSTVKDGKVSAAKKSVEFNRPFVYMIIDNESDIPVIIGVANDIQGEI